MIVYNKLYEAIKVYLNTVTGLRNIDWYNEQYLNTEDEKAQPFPAVYVEILDPVSWKQMTPGQSGTVRVKLHVVVYDIKDSPVPSLTFTQKVFDALHANYMSDSGDQLTTELIRDESNMPKRYGNLKVMHIRFVTEVYDASPIPATTPVANPNLNLSVPSS